MILLHIYFEAIVTLSLIDKFTLNQEFAKAPNRWALPLEEMYDNITLFSETKLLPAMQASNLKVTDMEGMLNWFRNDDVDI